jgi:hypothetical protein
MAHEKAEEQNFDSLDGLLKVNTVAITGGKGCRDKSKTNNGNDCSQESTDNKINGR